MPELWRLFFALDLPPEVKDSLTDVQRRLKRSGADARWVRMEGVHLTIKFLGNVAAERVGELAEAVRPAAEACPPLRLRPAGAGAFPRLNSPRVAWVGISGDTDRLAELAAGMERALEPLGFEPESRPFSPHLTLGRVKSSKGRVKLTEAIVGLSDYQGPEFTARELILYRSILGPHGARYEALSKIELIGR